MNSSNYYLHFDGIKSYIEIPDSPDFSVPTTGSLTVSAWINPSTLTFPSTERQGYVHWMGKGEARKQEWVLRMYSSDNSVDRANRISFYVFNLEGGLGDGSHYQDSNNPILAGEWIHVLGAADSERTYLYINGKLAHSNIYLGQIQPQHGTAPVRIGTRDFNSFFEGEIRGVRIWQRLLTDSEITSIYASDTAPQDGLVAEYLLTQDIAPDNAGNHDGAIEGGTWTPQ
jgi:hypothetical protein